MQRSLKDDFSPDPKVIRWIVGIFVGVFVVIMMHTIYTDSYLRGDCSRSSENFYVSEFEGTITRKFIDHSNHGARMLELDSNRVVNMYRAKDNVYLSIMEVGNYIVKKRNELNFTLVRGSDTIVYKEFIEDCEQYAIPDE